MHREGHIGIALLGYSPVAYLLISSNLLEPAVLGLVGVVFGSTLPDVDLNAPFLKHRGLTHSVVGAAVTGILYAAAALFLVSRGLVGSSPPLLSYLFAGLFAFGIGSYAIVMHLVGDVLTPMGIRPFQPFSDAEYTLNAVYAANDRANEALMTIGAISLIAAFIVGTLGVSYVVNGIIEPFVRAFG